MQTYFFSRNSIILFSTYLFLLQNTDLAYGSTKKHEYAQKNHTHDGKGSTGTKLGDSSSVKGPNNLQSAFSSKVERDFDKIRKFHSYDPATDKWSTIEDFETVEILEDTTQQREDRYIYYSFWAYDIAKKAWYKADIRGYGYRYKQGKHKHAPLIAHEEVLLEEKAKKNKFFAWKNLGLSFSIGGGTTFYNNMIQNLQLIERDGKYFVQDQHQFYLIRWFYKNYEKQKVFSTPLAVHGPKAVKKAEKDVSFQGYGFCIPISLSLHYTFLRRLRLGVGSSFEINYLKKLTTKGGASNITDYILPRPWLSNLKWFGLIGFSIMKKPKQTILLDVQLGQVYDVGSELGLWWKENKYLDTNWYVNVGLGYARKLNNYTKLLIRLSGDYKQYKHNPFSQGKEVTLKQPAIHLETGLTLNFGKDNQNDESTKYLSQPTKKIQN